MYELFFLTHRAAAIALVAMLWVHIKPRRHLSWALLMAGISLYGSASAFQFARQVYFSVDKHLNIGRVEHVTGERGLYVLEIRTARAWTVRPGTYVLFTVLNWRYASFLQRHPFVVAWYENWDGESSIYLVSQAQKGWTECIDGRLVDRKIWLDGPHGKRYDSGPSDLTECDTVLLVAEESGIFAHLLILKSLVESFRFGTTKTRRVVLMWNTTGVYFDSIQRWFTQLIVDTNEDPRVSALL